MRDDKRNYIVVGAFVITMLVALILWIAVLSGRTGATDGYYIVYGNVLGLKTGGEILYEGFPVGHIEGISPVEREGRRSYRLDVSVKRDWPIPEDSVAEVTAAGLLSAYVIDIQAGESQTLLEPGSEIEGQEAQAMLSAVNAVADEALKVIEESVRPMLASFAEGAPGIVDNVEQFTAELNETVDQINAILSPANVERVGQILQNLDSATGEFATLIDGLGETRQLVGGLITKLDALLEEDQGELSVAIRDLRHTLAAISRRIDSITSDLESTTRNLNEFSRQLRENPGVLVRGRETNDAGR
ncbi:MAG: MCE family protein [Deltaproteobacteria bacterium]|nr:MCE family protein [Deltaproteobacteria bacterium]